MTKEKNGRGETRTLKATQRRASSGVDAKRKIRGLRSLGSPANRSASSDRSNVATPAARPVFVPAVATCEACSFYGFACLRHYVEGLEVAVLTGCAVSAVRR